MIDSAAQYELYPEPPRTSSRRKRIGREFASGIREAEWVIATLAAFAPCALMVWPGWPRTIGIVYAILYVIALLPVTAVQLWLILEGALLLMGKRPLAIAEIWGEEDRVDSSTERPSVHRAIEFITRLTWTISPLSGLAFALIGLATRARPRFIVELTQEARLRRKVVLEVVRGRPDIGPEPVNPFTRLARPVAHRSARERRVAM